MESEYKASSENIKLEGRYSNFFKVGHNAFEFVLVFGQFYPENGNAQLHTRIITNPIYVKIFLKALQESIARYEKTFGEIQESEFEEKT